MLTDEQWINNVYMFFGVNVMDMPIVDHKEIYRNENQCYSRLNPETDCMEYIYEVNPGKFALVIMPYNMGKCIYCNKDCAYHDMHDSNSICIKCYNECRF